LFVGAGNQVEHEEVTGVGGIILDVKTVRHSLFHGTAVTQEEGVNVFVFITFEVCPRVTDGLFDGEGRGAETKVIIKFVPNL
jgi:hypothetical protein